MEQIISMFGNGNLVGKFVAKKLTSSAMSPVNGVTTLRISNVNWSPAPGEVCSEEGNFRRWEDNSVIPCKDGCEGSGN